MSIRGLLALHPWLGAIALAATAVCIGLAATAPGALAVKSVPTLNGDWAPFNRCPVHDATMLAADGETKIAFCMAFASSEGAVSIGGLRLTTGPSDVQAGLVVDNETSGATAISPQGGAIKSAPMQLPGGLQALLCPSEDPALRSLCRRRPGNRAGVVILTLEPAGELSEFHLGGALGTEESIASIPVKLHLENPLLGAHCTIGSNKQPIVLAPVNAGEPTSILLQRFDREGTPDQENGTMAEFVVSGLSQADDSFSVPGASGCGLLSKLNLAIDRHLGLPSPAGQNKLELKGTTVYLTGLEDPGAIAPNDGRVIAQNWRSARIDGEG